MWVGPYRICPLVSDLFHLAECLQGSLTLQTPEAPSFLRLNNIPLCEPIAFCLSVHLFMDVWVVLAIVKNAALNVNRVVQLFVRVPVFSASGYIPRNRIGGAVLVVLSCSAVSDSLAHEMWYLKACHVVVGGGLFAKSWPTFVTPWTAARQVPLSWGFSGENPGVGCNFLLQGIFPTKGLNPCLLYLLHCRWILYLLSHLDHMAILCLLFFFEEPTYSFPQWLYHFNSSNSKGSYYWSKGSLTFSCFFFFF